MAEEQPREDREAWQRGHDRAEVVAPDRHAHHDDGDREHADGDSHPGPRRDAPHEQPREQRGRRRELRERHVPLAHQPDADGRRVAEHGVPLEVRAGDEVDEVQRDHARERDQERAREPGRPIARNMAANTTATTPTNTQ